MLVTLIQFKSYHPLVYLPHYDIYYTVIICGVRTQFINILKQIAKKNICTRDRLNKYEVKDITQGGTPIIY
jgi:hypothetical protein